MLQNFTLNLTASLWGNVFNGFCLGKFYFKFSRKLRLKFRLLNLNSIAAPPGILNFAVLKCAPQMPL